jgi:hypothetical protein
MNTSCRVPRFRRIYRTRDTGRVLKVGGRDGKIKFEVTPPSGQWVHGHVPSLLSECGRYTLLSRGPDVDGNILFAGLLTVHHKSIGNDVFKVTAVTNIF